jgi:hypothetical protein
LDVSCFAKSEDISRVAFEPGSRLSQIAASAFDSCSNLSSICIPSSVENLGFCCFSGCRNLSTVGFECHSALSRIEGRAFCGCSSLASVCIPSSVKRLGELSFDGLDSPSLLSFESGSQEAECPHIPEDPSTGRSEKK